MKKILVGLVGLVLLVAALAWGFVGDDLTTRIEQRRHAAAVDDFQPVEVADAALGDTAVRGKVLKEEVAVAAPAETGEPFLRMEIPRFGRDWEWVTFEGTAEAVIDKGPGHYAGTALPGEVGNTSFAAHRAGHGDPFIDFDKLVKGDVVRLSQGRVTWTYRIVREPVKVDETDVWVLDWWREAPARTLTLTTCWPKYGSEKRLFVRAVLDNVSSKGER